MQFLALNNILLSVLKRQFIGVETDFFIEIRLNTKG
jgi:hypothetical protein